MSADWIDEYLATEIGRLTKGGRVLDLPAGDGNLSRRIAAAGCEVVPSDLFPEHFRWEAREVVRADMNQRLPFEDAEFDAVVCQEGIEHLEAPASFLRECSRILRPGGGLWLTTPNFMDLSSRLSFFLTGMKSFHAEIPNEETTLWGHDAGHVYHGHAFTLPYFQIRYLLRLCDFEAVELAGLGASRLSSILYPLVIPIARILLRGARRRRTRKQSKRAMSPALFDELLRHSLSRELLCSKKICVRAIRS